MNDAPPSAVQECLQRYWRANLKLTIVLLCGWALAGLGAGILFADKLDAINLPGTGYPLGFWFAQQGSIVVFVLLVLIYALMMNRLDRRHHEERMLAESEDAKRSKGGE